MGFPRQEYWSGFPFPSPVDLPDRGIELGSPALQADSLPAELPGKPKLCEWRNVPSGHKYLLSVCVCVCVCFPRQSLHPRNTVGKILKKDFFSWFIFLFFLFVCFIFNWRIVALQHCVGFWQISSWISHRYTYVPSLLTIPPPPSPSLPSRLLQSWETQTIEKSVSNHFR